MKRVKLSTFEDVTYALTVAFSSVVILFALADIVLRVYLMINK